MQLKLTLIFHERDRKEALDSLQVKRNGEVLREATMDSLKGLRDDGENILSSNIEWPGRVQRRPA